MENTPISTLHNLIDYDISRFISAEIQLKNSLPEWMVKASSLQLKNVLQRYLNFIQQHIERLEEFFEEEKIGTLSLHNPLMQAYITDTNEKLANCTHIEVRDACLLSCIQSINHFKISIYGTAAAFANALGLEKSASVFHEAEINEKHIDDRLSQLAEHEINFKAKSPITIEGHQ